MIMTVADVEHIIEEWAPRWSAWDRDNVGLQLGRHDQRVSKVLIALEITDGVVDEAIQKKIDLILTHHPPLFRPASSITNADTTGRNILALLQNRIAVYSAHTNLDFTRNGVSFVLAETLGLNNIRFLSALDGKQSKIVVFVPANLVEKIAKEMSEAGAGVIGNYESCSFRVEGTGTFEGTSASNPVVGNQRSFERVREVRLEMVAPSARVHSIIEAVKRIHPYEEVAYDIYPVNTPSANFGMGAFGELDRTITLQSLLQRCKRTLNARAIRYAGNPQQKIKTVAVCGGSCSDLLEKAILAKAEVFITADVRYHTFHSAAGRIALVDAGHWETEHGILHPLQKRLRNEIQQLKQKVSVTVAQISTNPVRSI
jgi:dinuclear metal center YbgI/SA1388 family protein